VTVKLKVPATVGVPKTAPDVALIAIPLGRPLADHVYGVWPPVAATAWLAAYPTPTVAVDGLSTVVVIVSVETGGGVAVWKYSTPEYPLNPALFCARMFQRKLCPAANAGNTNDVTFPTASLL
jgi:hypothetical protein